MEGSRMPMRATGGRYFDWSHFYVTTNFRAALSRRAQHWLLRNVQHEPDQPGSHD